MAKLRKASAYSKRYARPNTRKSKKKAKSFVKTIPQTKLVKFNIGKVKDYNKDKFNIKIRLVTEEKIQIRDNALEAARQFLTRRMDREMTGNFYLEIRTHPHHILRENKMLTGAGADRMQSGMKHSFGKAGGRAAMLKPGKDIFMIAVANDKGLRAAKVALNAVKAKLPCKTRLVIEMPTKKK